MNGGENPLGEVAVGTLPQDAELRRECLDAYRALRVNHQFNYATYKLSVDDKTFAGLSGQLLVKACDLLAGLTLLCAMICAAVRLFIPLEWAPYAGVSLAIAGVAVRAWRDGLAISEDRDNYQEMQHSFEMLLSRWDASANRRRAAIDRGRMRTLGFR